MIVQGLEAQPKPLLLPMSNSTQRSDPRGEVTSSCIGCVETSGQSGRITVYTDYSLIKELVEVEIANSSDPSLSTSSCPFTSRYRFIESREDADFLFILEHVRDFVRFPRLQRVCQFPFEGGLVCKDLLPLTVRKYSYLHLEDDQGQLVQAEPFWWLPCYDMSTEFHLFAQEYENLRIAEAMSTDTVYRNSWILKPAKLAQGKGHRVFSSRQSSLKDIATFVYEEELEEGGKGDRVAQQLVSKPALIRGRKMDLRLLVVVRSFMEPFEAFMCEYYYARLANKPYDAKHLGDSEIVLTVNAYNEDDSIASKQERVSYENLASELGLDDIVVDEVTGEATSRFQILERSIIDMMSHLFSSSGRSIGVWPQSSAYYCVDVILDWDWDASQSKCNHIMFNVDRFRKMKIPVPKLIEINFMGDFHAFEMAMMKLPYHDETNKISAFHHFAAEVLHCMVSKDPNPRGFARLCDMSALASG